jgi:hypothetical protein
MSRSLLILVALFAAVLAPAQAVPRVTAPPSSFFEIVPTSSREAAHKFYSKYIDVKGMPVVASGVVADAALQRTYWIVTHLLAGRPDVIAAMVKEKMYLIIIGKDQVYTDMPEYSRTPDPAYMNERVRGTGGLPTSFGEENLLCLPLDRYDDESIGVHEFCHTIDSAMASVDSTWNARRNTAYRHALAKGLWKGAYTASNPAEYWAEVCQSYFDCNRSNNWNHGPIANREQLKAYDPESYELARTAFNLKPEQDWRYTWLQKQPSVTPPPAKFRIDPYYTKFTWAREFTVVGRQASNEALLKANDTIRKMFAYRHDILKALIADGLKLVVLGPREHLYDLPEFKNRTDVDLLARYAAYSKDTKTLVVSEENVMADPRNVGVGSNQVIRVFADALYKVTAFRPVDPNWDKRGRSVQQYEIRVKRLDEEFGKRLKSLYDAAVAKGSWKGAAGFNSAADYWIGGVLAYFDATGQDGAPNDAPHPISTRELLKGYDPGLFDLVNETMSYDGHVDWRFRP